ncbi:MAG: hypothetical protein Q4G54_05710 [Pelistega sp.]|nr:hypothetical protein [Pelistega sp.]
MRLSIFARQTSFKQVLQNPAAPDAHHDVAQVLMVYELYELFLYGL